MYADLQLHTQYSSKEKLAKYVIAIVKLSCPSKYMNAQAFWSLSRLPKSYSELWDCDDRVFGNFRGQNT